MQKHLYIQTYGCQMNEDDSQKIAEILNQSHDLVLTTELEKADVILMNSCSVREKAEHKVLSEAGRWRTLKDKKPDLVIGIGGCVASQEGETLLKKAPYIDLVFGPQTLHRLPQMYDHVLTKRKSYCDVSFPEIEKFSHMPAPQSDGPSAYVSIMEGCSKYCSFCIVPYTRGEEISRPICDIIKEVYQLSVQGVKEIILLGQNVNDYKDPEDDSSLALLIHAIAEIESIERIRFTTSHPAAFTDDLIEAYAQVPKLVNHLHLPVQSGSDRILTQMKRGYSAAHFIERIQALRTVRPDIPVSSDFIVGFPGETDEDFAQTMDLVSTIGFDHSYSFIYSPRPGTPAADYTDDISMETKKQHLALLQQRLQRQGQCISESMCNQSHKVLVTGPSKQGDQLQGRTENNRVVNFNGPSSLIGQVIPVQINQALKFSLQGELVNVE